MNCALSHLDISQILADVDDFRQVFEPPVSVYGGKDKGSQLTSPQSFNPNLT